MTRLLAPLLALGLLLTACGDDGDDVGTGEGSTTTDDSASATEPATEPGGAETSGGPNGGGEYVATAITEGGEDRPLVAGSELRITFTPVEAPADALPQMTFVAGCNTQGASYDVDGDTLHLAPGFSTSMGCEQELMDQDAWLAGVLDGDVGWSLDGDTLTLSAGDVEITLAPREAVAPDADLAGPTWTLDTIFEGNSASSTPAGVVATITFADDGSYTLAAGCNTGGGAWTVDGSQLDLGAPRLTRMACEGDAGTVEAAVLLVVDGSVTWEVREGDLILTTADGSAGLGFVAT